MTAVFQITTIIVTWLQTHTGVTRVDPQCVSSPIDTNSFFFIVYCLSSFFFSFFNPFNCVFVCFISSIHLSFFLPFHIHSCIYLFFFSPSSITLIHQFFFFPSFLPSTVFSSVHALWFLQEMKIKLLLLQPHWCVCV